MANMAGKAGLQPCGRHCNCNRLSGAKHRKRIGKRQEERQWRREAAE